MYPRLTSSSAFGLLLVARAHSAQRNLVHDCDEVFNYWEPLHYLLYGSGLQTWEYRCAAKLLSCCLASLCSVKLVSSPGHVCCSAQFALRAWIYILLHAVVGAPAAALFGTGIGKQSVFLTVRAALAFLSAATEALLFRWACKCCVGCQRCNLTPSSGMLVAQAHVVDVACARGLAEKLQHSLMLRTLRAVQSGAAAYRCKTGSVPAGAAMPQQRHVHVDDHISAVHIFNVRCDSGVCRRHRGLAGSCHRSCSLRHHLGLGGCSRGLCAACAVCVVAHATCFGASNGRHGGAAAVSSPHRCRSLGIWTVDGALSFSDSSPVWVRIVHLHPSLICNVTCRSDDIA